MSATYKADISGETFDNEKTQVFTHIQSKNCVFDSQDDHTFGMVPNVRCDRGAKRLASVSWALSRQ